jgi:hypothetical protein
VGLTAGVWQVLRESVSWLCLYQNAVDYKRIAADTLYARPPIHAIPIQLPDHFGIDPYRQQSLVDFWRYQVSSSNTAIIAAEEDLTKRFSGEI